MTAVVSTRCRRCGAELRDRISRVFGIGPECRKTMTDTELRAAIDRNTPGHIPAPRPATATAHATNAAARQAAQAPTDADLCACGSGATIGRCPPCSRAERDPMGVLADGVARIIADIREQRRANRDAAYEAWTAAHVPEPEQLTIGAPT